MTLQNLLTEFEQKKNPSKAKILSRFFKTGKGEYGEGDVFLGISTSGNSKNILYAAVVAKAKGMNIYTRTHTKTDENFYLNDVQTHHCCCPRERFHT